MFYQDLSFYNSLSNNHVEVVGVIRQIINWYFLHPSLFFFAKNFLMMFRI